jgi:glycosyltransferase involved in cell wall biosynthesis
VGGGYAGYSYKVPQISILTPVWNGLPLVKGSVDSVLSQTFEDWELVISDNGSEDGTRDYLATLTDPRIRVFYQEQNLGITANVNFVLRNARAPICQFLCHDDYFMDTGSLSRIVHTWSTASADVAFIRANWNARHARNALEAYAIQVLPKRIEPRDSDLFMFIFGCIPGNLSNISMRTHLPEEMGWFDPRAAVVNDFDFWTRTARQRPFLLEASDFTYIRFHPNQASKYLNRRGEAIPQLWGIVDSLYARLKSEFPVRLLQFHATMCYDAVQRWVGVRRLLLDRNGAYLASLTEQAANRDFFLPAPLRWALFLLSGGGRWGRTLFARWLLAKHRQPSVKAAANRQRVG